MRERRRLILLGLLAAMGAASAYGVVQTLGRVVVTTRAHPIVTIAFASLFGLALMAPLFRRDLLRDRAASRRGVAWSLMAGVFSLGALGSMFTALQHAPVVVVSPVVAVYPLPTLVLARLFLGRLERLTPPVLIGTFLVVLGVVLVSVAAVG